MFPLSHSTRTSRCRSHTFLPGRIVRLDGQRDAWENIWSSVELRSDWRSSRAFVVRFGYAEGELF